VTAAAVSAAIILGIGPFARRQPPRPAPQNPGAVQPVVSPTPAPRAPDPVSPTVPTARPTIVSRGLLAEEVAAARLALAKGDLDGAATHLSEAARIDRTEPDLKEIAQQVVRGLVERAYAEAHNAHWDDAEPHLERAERTGMRFGIDTSAIDEARTSIAAMERYAIVGPTDRRAILQSVGRRVEVVLTDGVTRTGRIEGIEGGDLVLDVDNQVGGGAVRFTEEIPLSTVRSLTIYEN
jgi:hypothetical protein